MILVLSLTYDPRLQSFSVAVTLSQLFVVLFPLFSAFHRRNEELFFTESWNRNMC